MKGRRRAAGTEGNLRRKGGGQRVARAKPCPRCAAPLQRWSPAAPGGRAQARLGGGGAPRPQERSRARSPHCGTAEGGAEPRRSTGAAAPAGQAGRAPAHGRSRARRQPRARRRRPERGLAVARRGCRSAGARPPGTHPARSAGAGSPAGSAAASFVCVRGAAAAGLPGGLSALPARRRGREGTAREGKGGGEGRRWQGGSPVPVTR